MFQNRKRKQFINNLNISLDQGYSLTNTNGYSHFTCENGFIYSEQNGLVGEKFEFFNDTKSKEEQDSEEKLKMFVFQVADMIHGMDYSYTHNKGYPLFGYLFNNIGVWYRMSKKHELTLIETLELEKNKFIVSDKFKNLLDEFPTLKSLNFNQLVSFVDRITHSLPDLTKTTEKEHMSNVLKFYQIKS
jgi:hypothetical protein